MAEKEGSETDARSASSRPILNSWKEIAGYFQIDVRTCQRWEKSFGLPVHRMDHSSRSRVIAYPDELDRWRSQIYKAKNGGTAVPGEAPEPRPAKRKRVLFLLLPAAAVLLLGTIVGLDRVPKGFRIRESRLIVTNKFGLRLWSYDTSRPDLEQSAFFRDYFQEKKYASAPEGESVHFPMLFYRDLNGDGKEETLFVPQTRSGHGSDEICLFDSRGQLIWAFQTGQEVRIGKRDFSSDFVINLLDVQDFNGDGRLEILVGSHCLSESPTRIVLLDLQKNVLGEYWHFGQLSDYAFAPVGPEGRKSLVFVGQNNEYERPCLVVLDPLTVQGSSPQTPGSSFAGKERGRERYYVLFPNNEVDLIRSPRGTFRSIKLQANRHFLLESPAVLRVDIDPAFQSPQIIPTDIFAMAFREAQREKRIDRDLDAQAFIAEYAARIGYFDGRNWVSHPTQAHPLPAAPTSLRQPH